MKKYLLILVIVSSCVINKSSLNSGVNLKDKVFVFRSELRDMSIFFKENDYVFKIEYKCSFLDENEKSIIIKSDYKIINDSLLILNDFLAEDSIRSKLSNIKIENCIVRNVAKGKYINVWENDDGFLPSMDTLRIMDIDNSKILLYMTKKDRLVYNFIWVEL